MERRAGRLQRHPAASGMGPEAEGAPGHLWNVAELGHFLRKSSAAVYKMVERRQIPYLKVGSSVRFDPAAVRAWLAGCAVPLEASWGGH